MNGDQESLELAMALHRQLNAPKRRSRQEIEEEKRLKEKQKRKEMESSSSSSSEDDDQADDHNDTVRDQKEEVPLQGAAARRAKRRRKDSPRQLGPHEIAAATAVQKAAKAAKNKNGGQTHCKLFVAGIPWGVIIPKEALESRESLSEAAAKAFEKDGFVCRPEELEISIVVALKTIEHFPPGSSASGVISHSGGATSLAANVKATEGIISSDNVEHCEKEEDEEQQQERWAAAAQHAQRVYVSKIIKLQN
jgi:hypothetical protein